MTESCLYRGHVVHQRWMPVPHRFQYAVFMLYLDLDELPQVFDGHPLWSATHPALAWFRRADHMGDPRVPLADTVRDLVAERTGDRPAGPVRLLTHPRYLGIGFNPISVYYCHSGDDGRLTAVVMEVTNTPWGERHSYVIDLRDAEATGATVARGEFRKAMHVSPFLPMDMDYRWVLAEPSSKLAFSIDCRRDGVTVLSAGMSMTREELTGASMRRVLLRYPPMCAVVLGGIYWQAFRLWRKGVSYHARPRCPRAVDEVTATRPAALGHRKVA